MQAQKSGLKPEQGFLMRILLICPLLASLAVLLVYVRSLIYFNPPSVIFDLAYFCSILTLSILLVRFGPAKYNAHLLLVLLWVLVMRLLIPLRLPGGIISNYPDMIYELQVVRGIASSGTITLNAPTAFAEGYVFTPMLETLIVMSSAILGSPVDLTLKYAGPFFGVLTMTFLYGFYRAFLPNKESVLATFIAASCFWFISFDARTLHQSLALAFLSLALYTITKTGGSWRGLTILSIFGIVATHQFTAIIACGFFVVVAIVILLLSRSRLLKPNPIESEVIKMPAFMILLTFTQLVFVALSFFATSLTFGTYVVTALLGGAPITFQTIVLPSTPTGFRVIGDAGIAAFFGTCGAGFVTVMVRRGHSDYRRLVPYALGGAAVLLLGVLGFLKYSVASDLLFRGFIYAYFFAAPMALFMIVLIGFKSKSTIRKGIAIAIICMITLAGAYANYPRYFHDNSAPRDLEDVRFPLTQWVSAGEFAGNYFPQGVTVWGVRLAFDFIGGYGGINVQQILLNSTSLTQWVSAETSPGDVIVLRTSMANVSELYFSVNPSDLQQTLATNNIVYSSGEVVMVQRG